MTPTTSPTPHEINTLVTLFSQQRYADVESLAHALTVRFPNHESGWTVLGMARKQLGRSAEALAPLQHAVALSPGNADAHLNLGITLRELGRLEEAVSSYTQALQINPEFAEALYNLGNTLKDLGQLDAAAGCYQRALQFIPHNALVHNNLGAVQQESGRDAEAELSYRRALNIEPKYADAHYNLGTTLQNLDRLNEAETCYRRALGIRPDFTAALNSLAALLHLQGKSMLALELVKQSLRINATADAKRTFTACVKHLVFTQPDAELSAALVRALTEPWGRPSDLARASIELIKLNPDSAACITRATHAGPEHVPEHELYAANGLRQIATDPLLHALLESTPVCDVAMERFLTRARRHLLERAARKSVADAGPALNFYCALACQCFINEYVFAVSDAELQQAHELRNMLVSTLAENMQAPSLLLIAIAAYFPLHSLPYASRFIDYTWPDVVTALLVQQVHEPAEEQQLRATLPQLTRIEDDVSLQVQTQYEENPYPRWIKTAPAGEAKALGDYLRHKFPHAAFTPYAHADRIEILVAGCGTGQHPIATAQRIQGAHILAVDLSRSSLSYAKRKTLEMNLQSIEFAQADLLKLPSLERTFDVIESVGVLHHLADPWAGWRALLSILRPGGFMKLGFYSAIARREVMRVRDLIARRGHGSTPEAIRQFRQELLASPAGGNFGNTLLSPDFYSMSTCRDLLFHVHEQCMTLNGINAFLHDNTLHFLGFEIEGVTQRAYQQRFPQDRAATNLDTWKIFEAENPGTFANMYQFWIQKPGS